MPVLDKCYINFHGYLWEIIIPIEWRKYIEKIFRNIQVEKPTKYKFTVQCSVAAEPEKEELIRFREDLGVDEQTTLV